MMRLRLGIDVDGIVANFTPKYLEKLIELSGHRPEWDATKDPDCWNWAKKYGFSHSHNEAFWEHAKSPEGEGVWSDLQPLVTSDEVTLLQHYIDNEDVYFISNRALCHRRTTDRWLRRVLGDREFTTILTREKGMMANALQLHGLIDDKPKNLTKTLEYCGLVCVPVLVNRPWNQEQISPYIHRVHTIAEGLDKIKEKAYNG